MGLTLSDLEAMAPDEVDIRLEYGRAPIRSLSDYRTWIHLESSANRCPKFVRLRSDESMDFQIDLLSRLGYRPDFPERPADVPNEGTYLGQMYGVNVIEDS